MSNGIDHHSVQLPPYSPPDDHSKPPLPEKTKRKSREQAVGDFEWGPWTIEGKLPMHALATTTTMTVIDFYQQMSSYRLTLVAVW